MLESAATSVIVLALEFCTLCALPFSLHFTAFDRLPVTSINAIHGRGSLGSSYLFGDRRLATQSQSASQAYVGPLLPLLIIHDIIFAVDLVCHSD